MEGMDAATQAATYANSYQYASGIPMMGGAGVPGAPPHMATQVHGMIPGGGATQYATVDQNAGMYQSYGGGYVQGADGMTYQTCPPDQQQYYGGMDPSQCSFIVPQMNEYTNGYTADPSMQAFQQQFGQMAFYDANPYGTGAAMPAGYSAMMDAYVEPKKAVKKIFNQEPRKKTPQKKFPCC